MRKAISYWAMRACVSGSPSVVEGLLVQAAQRIEHPAARGLGHPGRIGEEQHRIALAAQRTPWCLLGRKPEPHRRLYSA
jgi:hypothetical protein